MLRENCVKLDGLLQFLHISNNLKQIFRSHTVCAHRLESVADHSWKLALMVIVIAPHLDQKIDLEKALKMAIIHDLGECIIGDANLLDILNNAKLAKDKKEGEYQFFLDAQKLLKNQLGEDIFKFWIEFEENVSYEAKVVNALDKLEAQLQQNEIGVSNLEKFSESGKMEYIESFFKFDSFIASLKNEIFGQAITRNSN